MFLFCSPVVVFFKFLDQSIYLQGKRIKIIGQRVAEDWTNEERGFAA
jgi:hypothetical protein